MDVDTLLNLVLYHVSFRCVKKKKIRIPIRFLNWFYNVFSFALNKKWKLVFYTHLNLINNPTEIWSNLDDFRRVLRTIENLVRNHI